SAEPAAFRSARSALSFVRYAADPLRSITRTVTRSGPEPKDARTAGAHAVARLLPNRLRTAGVSTTTAELTGTSEPDPTASSFPAGNPRALRAAHIAGSQETTTSRLTCWATQVAAATRAAAAWRAAAGLVGLAPGERSEYLIAAAASTPANRTTTTSMAASRARDPPAGRGEPAWGRPAAPGLTEDGGWAVVPSHWVISSSAIGPAFAARAGLAGGLDAAVVSDLAVISGPAGGTGSGPVSSPPGASSCLVAAPERSALTAARMRRRRSSESTEEDGARAGGPDRVAPRTRCGSSLPGFSSAMRVIPPARHVYKAIRPHGIAQHRMGGHSSRTMKSNRKSAYSVVPRLLLGHAAARRQSTLSRQICGIHLIAGNWRLTSGLRCPYSYRSAALGDTFSTVGQLSGGDFTHPCMP